MVCETERPFANQLFPPTLKQLLYTLPHTVFLWTLKLLLLE